jgi:signal transduction histidine kinase
VKSGYSFINFVASTTRSRRETALLGAAAVILLAITGYSYWIAQRQFQDAEIAARLNGFNAKLVKFVQMLRTVESSQRGYILTDSPLFLEPYGEMIDQLIPVANKLEAEAPRELKSVERIRDILDPLKTKVEEMSQTVALVKSGQKDRAIERVRDGLGRNLTAIIEADIGAIADDGQMLVRSNEESTRRLQTFKLFIDGVGAFLILSFSFLALWLLLRSNAAISKAQAALFKANIELEDTVAHRTAELRRANEEIQRFAYIISHDLRSPLINIMGFTSELEILRKELFERLGDTNKLAGAEGLDKDFDEALGFIQSSIARMDRLIAAILKISREGSRPLNPEPIETKALVETLLANVEHQLREKNAAVRLGELPPIVTDRLSIEQIFSNLIENAIKFLQPGQEGRITVDGSDQGAEVVYTVSDNGRGIDPKDHQRIFELFRRAGPQDVRGEGMGLAYVSALLRRLGGTIAVESKLNHGSVFRLTLPRTLAQPDRKAA